MFEPKTVPIVGFVGAGQEVFQLDDQNHYGEAEAPPGPVEVAVAVEVRGDSMWPLLDDGSIVYYATRERPPEELVGYLCVVQTGDGRTFIKRLRRGRDETVYTLESYNAPPIENVPVVWAARIEWMRQKPN